ncbi:TlpA family protein disulfide reductase [Terrisporobacter mayombei]|uniref:Thiol-disulfide oxidoreductase ResA n=1 Tax=Terrisporobacter mayombei TaxID=1541 RepID=A0ABY9PXH5_9FIRM|nr:TlpA disulfide reductase family protein [Terrisporobacter mayombei]MCC3868234.1 TlpA family protein disulfide reductase [Terrisporobacter mayombei]WMT80373.1 Thiol-disulfide oxidoreductase ResA [Terrisporobacter mayombei]
MKKVGKVIGIIVGVIVVVYGVLQISILIGARNEPDLATMQKQEKKMYEEDNARMKNIDLSNFQAEDLDGNIVTQEIFSKNKITLIDIWTTDCSPCIDGMPDLAKLQKENLEGVGIFTVCIDAAYSEKAEKFAKELMADNNNIPTLIPDKKLMNGLCDHIPAYPTHLFVDSKGKVIGDRYVGGTSTEELKEEISKRLEMAEKNKK